MGWIAVHMIYFDTYFGRTAQTEFALISVPISEEEVRHIPDAFRPAFAQRRAPGVFQELAAVGVLAGGGWQS
jgi:hypothetical protein